VAKNAALKGIGLVQLPGYHVKQHLDSGALLPVLNQYAVEGEGVWSVYPHNRHLSPRIRMLVDHLAEHLG